MKRYKTIFMGTPEFSVPFLQALLKADFLDVVGVITVPDKPAGRGKKLQQSAVAEYITQYNSNANNYGMRLPHPSGARNDNVSSSRPQWGSNNKIKVFKPDKIKNLKLKIKNLRPDVAVVVAYGQIIPQKILDIPKFGAVNVHPSLLPKYRGPDPLRVAILNGDEKTGISIMKIDAEMDHGPIINQAEINITKDDNLGDLYKKVLQIGPDFMIKSLKFYLEKKLKPIAQNHSDATFTKMIKKNDAEIDWDQSSAQINRHIQAFNPTPGAYTYLNGKILKICQTRIKDGKLKIDRVKLEGKKEISWKDFLNGYKEQMPKKIIDKMENE